MFQDLINLLTNPLVLKVIIGYWTFSAFVGALPSPDVLAEFIKSPVTQLFYRFFFGFMHGVSGNISRAALAFKIPGAVEDKS